MLTFTFSPEGHMPKTCPSTYPALLRYNGAFSIEIGGEILFTEPSFPIFEFLAQANDWLSSNLPPETFEYVSLETDDNPLICFQKDTMGRFIICSPWQLFECSHSFSFDEICQALDILRCALI